MAKISEKIAALPPYAPFFSLEFFPPKTEDGYRNFLPRLSRIATLQPLFVCVTFGAGGSTASKSIELADFCQNQLDLTTCLHLTCTNISKDIIDNALSVCKSRGIRNILALRGDEPRPGEYAPAHGTTNGSDDGAAYPFNHAIDLIRYIRQEYGSYFCVGVAAYPEGHPIPSPTHAGGFFQSPQHDLPYLVEKVEAGADFILTQLFYDVDKFLDFEKLLADHESGVFSRIPIIPGLMPVQGWQSFVRTCKLAKIGLPEAINSRLATANGDDAAVKDIGFEIVSEIVEKIQSKGIQTTSRRFNNRRMLQRRSRGFHFYTLNLEKGVAQILERCNLLGSPTAQDSIDELSMRFQSLPRSTPSNGDEVAITMTPGQSPPRGERHHRRKSSTAHNRVIVSRPSTSSTNADFEALEDEAAIPRQQPQTKGDALAIAEGEGSLGREATWDDFPNGRWGDSRSPAYAAANSYSLHPLLSPISALKLWGEPTDIGDISSIFRRFLLESLPAIPWGEDGEEGGLSAETALIKDELLRMNERNWWTIASQPAVNAAKSNDDVVGWGPKQRGFVWQKPFVEFFISSKDWKALKHKLDEMVEEVVYFAGNAKGEFQASDEAGVHPVTWGSFKGKEIVTPTIIESVSFRDWQNEAFSIWQEWQSVFRPSSPSAKLLGQLREDVWLVNVIGFDHTRGGKLWSILLDE